MSIQTELTRISNAKAIIRNKLIALGLIGQGETPKIEVLASKIGGTDGSGGIPVYDTISASVKEGETYTIHQGYHMGGTVAGVSGGGNYNLQTKSVTPSKSSQTVSSDDGYYGLSSVTVNAIPAAYQDVTSVTATADDVLSTKIIVESDGSITAGTMVNNGAVSKTLTTSSTSYTVPKGYHSGLGKVNINVQSKTQSPGAEDVTVSPDANYLLSSVTISGDTNLKASNIITGTSIFGVAGTYTKTGAGETAVNAATMLTGRVGWANGTKISGSMANRGSLSATITGLGTVAGDDTYTIAAGYYSGGSVSLTSDILTQLEQI